MSTKDGADVVMNLIVIGMIVTALPTVVALLWILSLMIPGKRLDNFLLKYLFPFTIMLLLLWRRIKGCILFFWRRK